MPKSKKRSSAKEPIEIGIIGGSGLSRMPGLSGAREVRVKTPFGDPSDAFITGTLEDRRVAFLARHGRGHLLSPSEINYRANIFAMKLLGAERIISVSAVGSLRDDLPPLDFLIPDQFFDRTRLRVATFFGGGIVAHVGFDKPTCTHLSAHLADASEHAGVKPHRGGTHGCCPPPHAAVPVTEGISNLNRNAENVQRAVREAVRDLPEDRGCKCGSALAHAILTDRKMIPAAAKKRLAPLVGRYLS